MIRRNLLGQISFTVADGSQLLHTAESKNLPRLYSVSRKFTLLVSRRSTSRLQGGASLARAPFIQAATNSIAVDAEGKQRSKAASLIATHPAARATSIRPAQNLCHRKIIRSHGRLINNKDTAVHLFLGDPPLLNWSTLIDKRTTGACCYQCLDHPAGNFLVFRAQCGGATLPPVVI